MYFCFLEKSYLSCTSDVTDNNQEGATATNYLSLQPCNFFENDSNVNDTSSSMTDDEDKDPTFECDSDAASSCDSTAIELPIQKYIRVNYTEEDKNQHEGSVIEELGRKTESMGGDSQYAEELPTTVLDSNNELKESCSEELPIVYDLYELQDSDSELKDKNSKTDTGNPKKKRIRSKDFCFYCETQVTQFARHVIRNHPNEIEVQKIKALPKKGKERKKILTVLRKKGNYLYSSIGEVKPVRKQDTSRSPRKVAPCTYCLGFYARKQLWRHRKACSEKPENTGKSFALREAQNLLLSNITVDIALKEKVFPRMMADEISLAAKKDMLICLYGSRHLKTQREKHQINVTSRKMRELGRLLVEIKKRDNSINNLLQSLRASKFKVIVEAIKTASKYDACLLYTSRCV